MYSIVVNYVGDDALLFFGAAFVAQISQVLSLLALMVQKYKY
jgi:hypothetical protein